MKYVVVHAGVEQEIEVKALGDGRFDVVAFGKQFTVGAQALPNGGLFLERDNEVFELDFAERVHVRGHELAIDVLNTREAQQRRMQAESDSSGGTWEIKAPMPGKVVALLVKPGDQVAAGQGIIVIEAMKMENELRAPKAGVISAIHVQPGSTVEARAILVSSS